MRSLSVRADGTAQSFHEAQSVHAEAFVLSFPAEHEAGREACQLLGAWTAPRSPRKVRQEPHRGPPGARDHQGRTRSVGTGDEPVRRSPSRPASPIPDVIHTKVPEPDGEPVVAGVSGRRLKCAGVEQEHRGPVELDPNAQRTEPARARPALRTRDTCHPVDVKVVALVSSAGGLEATRVLADLRQDFPRCGPGAPTLPPDRTNVLPDILQRHTTLSVAKAQDMAPLEARHVHVAPSGCHTLIALDGHVSLILSGSYPPARPSADLLLATLAMAFGEGAIAVVMSGTGHDAATGATVVHKCGGVVLATDEETSAHFSMPAATITRDDIVDAIVPVPELAGRLIELVTIPAIGE